MTITLERPDLRSLTPAELAELAAIGAEHNGELAEQVAAEKSRRERVRRMAARRVKMISGEGIYNAEAQYAQARAELNGQLVAHHSKWPDDFALWFGNEATARANATTDLCEWWDRNPRIAAGAFDEQLAAHDRAAREAYEHDRMDRDDSPAVRPGSASGAGIDVPRAGSAGNRRHGGTDRPGGHVTTITGERCMHNDATCTHKSPAGIAARAARQGTGTFGGQATVAVREDGAVAATRQPDVSGAEVLRAIRICLGHFAVWPSEDALTAATLWVAQSHAKDPAGAPVWAYAPRFMLLSREGGSGKSWMARLMAKLAPEGRMLVEMTKAALIQQIAEHRTVVVDETDILFGSGNRNAGIRALVNAGYEPDQSTSRMRGRQSQEVPLFGPMILAGLDKLKDATGDDLKTLISRCIIVHVRRAPDGYRPPRFDNEARAIALVIGQRAARWMAQEVANGIGDVVPDVPEGLGNRPSALWEPLFAVADAAGGDWPVMAREACVRLERAAGVPDEEEEAIRELDDVLAGWDTAGSGGVEIA